LKNLNKPRSFQTNFYFPALASLEVICRHGDHHTHTRYSTCTCDQSILLMTVTTMLH